ncbi:heterokaryon incompatibility protein-domain-containing protein [Nemania sp. FL0031]|nr:heterokaryon incompatibility protein-domain-containing protein [Nemania sp. FL0031]
MFNFWDVEKTWYLAPAAKSGSGAREFALALRAAWAGAVDLGPLETILESNIDWNMRWTESDMIANLEKCIHDDLCYNTCPSTVYSTPLHMAVMMHAIFGKGTSGHFVVEELFVRYGADVNCYNARGRTVIHELLDLPLDRCNSFALFLLRHGANINALTESDTSSLSLRQILRPPIYEGITPLLQAVRNQDGSLMQFLIEAGADINFRSASGWSPADVCIVTNFAEGLRILISNGAEIWVKNGSRAPTVDSDDISLQKQGMLMRLGELRASNRPLYYSIISSRTIQTILRDLAKGDSLDVEMFITAFHDNLSMTARLPNPTRISDSHCNQCIVMQELGKPITWPSLLHLRDSAQDGCTLCRLLFEAIIQQPEHYQNYQIESQTEVTVTLRDKDIGIRHGNKDCSVELCMLSGELDPTTYPHTLMNSEDAIMNRWDNVGDHQDSRTFSPASCQLAKNWLGQCRSFHGQHCARHVGGSQLPTRVINVGQGEEQPSLLVTSGRRGLYCALSYCWGKANFITATRASLSNLIKGIPTKILPRTIKDAIEVTKSLGFQYLWVDSLCILQDDPEDWYREASHMADVYLNAEVTIAATSAHDADGGLFGDSSSYSQIVHPVKLKRNRCLTFKSFRQSPFHGGCWYVLPYPPRSDKPKNNVWRTRGWTLQEELLSPRVLSFDSGALQWGCSLTSSSGRHPYFSQQTDFDASTYVNFLSSRQKRMMFQNIPLNYMHQTNARAEDLFCNWEDLVVEFTSRALSRRTDKILAILGLATQISPLLKSSFTQGFWNGPYSQRSLAWEIDHPAFSPKTSFPKSIEDAPGITNLVFPSWSWASVDSPVKYSILNPRSREFGGIQASMDLDSPLEILSIIEETINGTEQGKRFSLRASGYLRRGDSYMLKDFEAQEKRRWSSDLRPSFRCGNGGIDHVETAGRVNWDRGFNQSLGWWCLVLGRLPEVNINNRGEETEFVRAKKPACIICLCLAPQGGGGTHYQRVGICELQDDNRFWDGSVEKRIINLI